jgi:stage III sporulation protein AC
MELDLIFQIAGVGIIVAVLTQVLEQSGRKEQATMVSLAGLVIVLVMIIREIGVLFDTIRMVFGF